MVMGRNKEFSGTSTTRTLLIFFLICCDIILFHFKNNARYMIYEVYSYYKRITI